MRDENTILQEELEIVRDIQQSIRKALTQRGKSLKVTSSDSQIGYSTLLTYFPEGDQKPAALSVAALRLLLKALPLDILSLLLPDGFGIIKTPEGIDHDDIERACRDFLSAKGEVHHPESPAGREIADCERETLNVKVVQLRGKVRA